MRMTVTRRTFLGGATALAGAAALSGLAFAETYPSKPISYIVPYNPGGASDVIARLIAEKITAKTGQQVVIDYKTGAGGAIGANYFFRQPPDGYTLMAGTTSFFTTIPRSQPIEYDPDKDLIPVAMTGESYLPLAVHPSVPANTAAELFAYAKANPGKLTFASSGIGTGGHLVYEYLQMRLGIEMIHVPYKGASEALNALAAGEVDIGMDTGSTEFILDGRLRGLAVLNKRRWDRLPDVPTIEEAGLPDWPIRSWHTVLVPGGTPKEIVTALNAMINEFLTDPAVVEKLHTFGLEPEVMSVEDVAARIEADKAAFGPILDAAGIKPKS